MRFDAMLVGFLILSLFLFGGSMMIADINRNYDDVNMSSEDFDGTFDYIDDMYSITSDAKEKTLEGDTSETDSWESMTKGSYSAVRLVKGSFGLFSNVSGSIAKKLQIPLPFTKVAFIAFSIAIIFSIVYMIFRFIPK